jgi:uncharacterized protein (TIGR00730 family)
MAVKKKKNHDIAHHTEQITQPQKRSLLLKDLKKESGERMLRIDRDFTNGFDTITRYHDTVTIFGSARFDENHHYYKFARDVGAMLATEGYTVITGGGGGVMEAGNRGAFENGGQSIGFNIQLPMEQHLNPYTTESVQFRYFFSRKVMMAFATEALICFPGGFGTLDELFEVLTLVQTGKVPPAPIILVGAEFWDPLDHFIHKHLLEGLHAITPGDEKLYTITDDLEVIKQILNKRERDDVISALSGSTK